MSAIPKTVFDREVQPAGSASAANEVFLKCLPAVRTHAAIQFRNLREVDREEAIAEAVAAGLVNIHSATANGQLQRLTPSTVATFAVLHVKDGRHVGGRTDSTTDVLSGKAQQVRGYKALGLAWNSNYAYDCLTDPTSPVWKRALLEDRRTPVPDQVAFRIDWSVFLRSQHDRTRMALAMLAEGYQQTEVADRLGVTPAAVCQRLKRAEREWLQWQREDQRAIPSPPRL